MRYRGPLRGWGGGTSVIVQLYGATYPRAYQAHVGRLKPYEKLYDSQHLTNCIKITTLYTIHINNVLRQYVGNKVLH